MKRSFIRVMKLSISTKIYPLPCMGIKTRSSKLNRGYLIGEVHKTREKPCPLNGLQVRVYVPCLTRETKPCINCCCIHWVGWCRRSYKLLMFTIIWSQTVATWENALMCMMVGSLERYLLSFCRPNMLKMSLSCRHLLHLQKTSSIKKIARG